MKLKIPILLLVMFAAVTAVESRGIPNGIKKIVGGEAFWDGGSIILEFVDEDQRKWQAYLNWSLGEKKERKKKSITVTELSNGFGEKIIHEEGKLLEKNSKIEERFLKDLSRAIDEGRTEGEHTLEMAKQFLEKKRRSNKAVEAMPTNVRLFCHDPMNTNLNRLGTSIEVGIASL
ncbi:hypothetical protein [Pelagicoccus mobilis]|uniref:Uncharacterized protein n=1 Tax=Pelagicoccus mobilis TaxID=415221 RepID=A0A934RV90_9BACT|nr:hypothetical protein [Pelagicoccus mobilis]MBK1877091.1 hypothetical protein [Pelagicoccus mobilis]